MPSVDANGQPLGTNDTITYLYNAAARTLQRTVARTAGVRPNQTLIVARDLTAVIFSLAPNPVTITLIGSRTERRRTYTMTLTGRVVRRNS